MKIKSVLMCALSAVLLCSCANAANSEEGSDTTVENEVTTQTELSTAAETTETEEAVTEEVSKAAEYSFDDRVQSYMEKLMQLDSFNDVLSQAAYCFICDLDSNDTPDVVIQAAANRSLSAVFSVDDEGAFMAEPDGGTIFTDERTWCSYNGDIPQSFILDGKDQYFSECFDGGTSGDGGIIKLVLNGRKLSSEYIGHYSFSSTMGYEYSGFENEDQYNEYIRSYFRQLEPQWKLMPYRAVLNYTQKSPLHIVSLLEEYYKDRDSLAELDEVLDDDLEYEIEFKPIFRSKDDGLQDEYSYTYDYAGNPLEDEYYRKLRYTYYPSGKIKSKIYENGSIYTYDEDGKLIPDNDILTYDDLGRIETRTVFGRSTTKYFYKDDTNEIIKKIQSYTDGKTDTYTYENGLEVRFERNGDTYYNTVITKEYNANGLILKFERFDCNMNLSQTISYEYDSDDRLICEESVTTEYYDSGSDKCVDYCDSYQFDDDGKLLLKILDLRSYGDTLTYEYIYDKDGNLSEEIYTADHDNDMAGYSAGTIVTKYSYEFDLAGNIIHRIEKCENYQSVVTDYKAVRVIKAKETLNAAL